MPGETPDFLALEEPSSGRLTLSTEKVSPQLREAASLGPSRVSFLELRPPAAWAIDFILVTLRDTGVIKPNVSSPSVVPQAQEGTEVTGIYKPDTVPVPRCPWASARIRHEAYRYSPHFI